jgi:hypothetical protein
MAGISGKKPGQAASQQDAGSGHYDEFTLAARTEDASQNQKRQRVGRQVLVRPVKKRRKDDPGEAADLARPYAALVKVAAQHQIIDEEDQPAECGQ